MENIYIASDLLTEIVKYSPLDRVVRLSLCCKQFSSGYVLKKVSKLNIDELPTSFRRSAPLSEFVKPDKIFWKDLSHKLFQYLAEVKQFVLSRLKFARVVVIAPSVLWASKSISALLQIDKIERLELPDGALDPTVLSHAWPNLRRISIPLSLSSAELTFKFLEKNAVNIETIIWRTSTEDLVALRSVFSSMSRARAATLKRIDLSKDYPRLREDPNQVILKALFPQFEEAKNLNFVPVRQMCLEHFGVEPHILYIGNLPMWYTWITLGPRTPKLGLMLDMWAEMLPAGSAPISVKSSCILAASTAASSAFRVLTTASPDCVATLNWILGLMDGIISSPEFSTLNLKQLASLRSELSISILILFFSRGVGDFVHTLPDIITRVLSIIHSLQYTMHELILEGLGLNLDRNLSWRALEHLFLRCISSEQQSILLPHQYIASRFATKFASSVSDLSANHLPKYLDVGLLCLEHFPVERSALVQQIAKSVDGMHLLNYSGAPSPLPWPESVRATKLLLSCESSSVCSLIQLRKIGDIVEKQNLLVRNCVRGRIVPQLLFILNLVSNGRGLGPLNELEREALNENCWRVVLRDVSHTGGSLLVQNNLYEVLSQLISAFGAIPRFMSESDDIESLLPDLRALMNEKH